MTKRTWADLSPGVRAMLIVVGLVEVVLFTAAQIDLSRRTPDQVSGSKARWRLLSFLNIIGPLAYFWRGRKKAIVV